MVLIKSTLVWSVGYKGHNECILHTLVCQKAPITLKQYLAAKIQAYSFRNYAVLQLSEGILVSHLVRHSFSAF